MPRRRAWSWRAPGLRRRTRTGTPPSPARPPRSLLEAVPEDPVDDHSGPVWALPQPGAEVFADGLPDASAHLGAAEQSKNGAEELRAVQLHRHDRAQALSDPIGAWAG